MEWFTALIQSGVLFAERLSFILVKRQQIRVDWNNWSHHINTCYWGMRSSYRPGGAFPSKYCRCSKKDPAMRAKITHVQRKISWSRQSYCFKRHFRHPSASVSCRWNMSYLNICNPSSFNIRKSCVGTRIACQLQMKANQTPHDQKTARDVTSKSREMTLVVSGRCSQPVSRGYETTFDRLEYWVLLRKLTRGFRKRRQKNTRLHGTSFLATSVESNLVARQVTTRVACI